MVSEVLPNRPRQGAPTCGLPRYLRFPLGLPHFYDIIRAPRQQLYPGGLKRKRLGRFRARPSSPQRGPDSGRLGLVRYRDFDSSSATFSQNGPRRGMLSVNFVVFPLHLQPDRGHAIKGVPSLSWSPKGSAGPGLDQVCMGRTASSNFFWQPCI